MKKIYCELISGVFIIWKSKLLKRMRIVALLILITITQTFALDSYAQSKRLSLNFKNEKIIDILDKIEEQSEFYFMFDASKIDIAQRKSINCENQVITSILDQLFENTGITYRISDRQIGLISTNFEDDDQEVKVSGKVTDSSGSPLPGVTVVVKGTTNGTITNFDGLYTLSNVPSDGIIQFSFVGMKMQEISVSGKTSIDVVMEEDAIGIEEVVAVGYGTQKKVNLTGAVSSINTDELESRPLTNASLALQGKVAGVYALQQSGKPGGDGAIINIRGVGTLNDSSPLVLIDEFPGNISDVNPNDIESISVLKDASSSAIYGNRAANGVILITTKRGKTGEMQVQYNGYFGIQEATRLPDVFNSLEYARGLNEANINSGLLPRFSEEEIQKFEDGNDPMYPDINYFDVYYDKATIQEHDINLNGGSENLKYSFMLGYLNQEGILVGTDNKKINFRSNLDSYFLDNKLRISARLSGNKGERNEPTEEWNAKWGGTIAPIWPIKNELGQWVAVNNECNFYGQIMDGSTNNTIRYFYTGQIDGEYKLTQGLSAQITYGYSITAENSNSFIANTLLAKLDGSTIAIPAFLTETNISNTQTILTSLLKYEKILDKHQVKFLGGYSEEEFNWRWFLAQRESFVNNTQRYLRLGNPATMKNDGGATDLGLQSVFGRINYVFDQKYLFEANIRYDGSSRFGKDFRWGTFPSFSAGWLISEENFVEDVEWLNTMKIRLSWGRLGNQNINTLYAASDILSTGQNYSFGGTLSSGVAINEMSNKETTWESTEQMNIGMDLVINKEFSFTADYFQKTTKDILMQVPIPYTMGALSSPFQNVGEVKNSGIEITSSFKKQLSKDLSFNATLNLYHIKNEVVDLYDRDEIINQMNIVKEGYAINSFYGYKVDGIYQISDFSWQNNSDPNIAHQDRNYILNDGVVTVANFNPQPGDIKFMDLSGDNHVTMTDDRTVIGKQFPDLGYSLQLDIDWKNFDFGVFCQGVQGMEGYTYQELSIPFSNFSNTAAWWRNRWTPDNPSNEIPRFVMDETRTFIHSEFYLENASYFRIKNIELGYTLKDHIVSGIGLNKVRFYGNIQNALTISKYRGFDPEQPVGETRAHAYPQVRIYTLGLNINF